MAQFPEYGLHIQSYPLPTSGFTSMALDDGKYIATDGRNITLGFSLWVRPDNVFGTVFRVITDNNKNIDIMYSVGDADKRFPILVTGDAVHPIQKEVRREAWVEATLTLDFGQGKVTARYDGTEVEVAFAGIKGARGIRVAFGLCPFDGFQLTDVASVDVRDISVKRDAEEIRHWKMARHNKDVCYDEIAHSPATGKNTRWIIDQYVSWKKIHTQDFASSPSVAFNPLDGTFYMANDKRKLYVFHADRRATDTIRVKGGEFAANFPNQLIYIPQCHQLLSYNLNENLFSPFDPATRSWEGPTAPVSEHDYWNNAIAFNPADSSLVSFGGYGHYHYNNKLLISYPYRPGAARRELTLSDIDPRYSCSSAIVDGTLYLFGGRGCPSGRQELSPRNYYDLYAVNLLTQQVNKLWETSNPVGGEFQPSENMVWDAEKKCFYFFCTQQGGTLMKIDTQSPRFEVMSLPTNSRFESQYLYSNLYYAPARKKLYVAIHRAEVSGEADLEIFEMNFPPIPISSLNQPDAGAGEAGTGTGTRLPWIYAACALALLVAGAAYSYYRRRTKGTRQAQPAAADNAETRPSAGGEEMPPINVTESTFSNYDFSRKCVCFLGGFRVIDREGRDITAAFTPTLASLLILLILYTGRDPKGIAGHKLLQLLWYDKSDESAKNNRNVYVSKLRGILEKVGDIKILNLNGYWSIRFEEGTLCDYLEAIRLDAANRSTRDLERLLELLLRGMMLPNIETDWIDVFKNNFSNDTIDVLCRLLEQDDLPETLKLRIADTLFQHDYINEDALRAKCRILARQGKKGLAKNCYDTFRKEYATSLGVGYKYSFMEVIGKEE
jgi:DNA-binding SARP family transcriptional activator